MATFTAAGPSGWTAELLVPLLDDKVCKDGITLLVRLIANNDLDIHSRNLLTSSMLHAIPKPMTTFARWRWENSLSRLLVSHDTALT